MDGNDPDLEAFDSNLRAIIRARELGKTAAFMSNPCPNASDAQSAGGPSKDNAQQEPHCEV